MNLYTVGDSHAWHAWLKIPGVIIKQMGPMTMHSFGLSKPCVVTGIPDDATVCFCWGEIDCRCHVYKHPPWQECVDELVKNYLEAIKKNIADPKRVWIFNVVPPIRRKKAAAESPEFPFLGTDEERLQYVKHMNKKLSESEYTFVDVYDRYADEDGYLYMPKSDGHVHIADEKPLVEWIKAREAVTA